MCQRLTVEDRLARYRRSCRERKRKQRAKDRAAHHDECLELFDETENWAWIERQLELADKIRRRGRGIGW